MINQQQNCSTCSKADEQISNIHPVITSLSGQPAKTHHSYDGDQHLHYHQVDELQLLEVDKLPSTHPVDEITKEEPAVKMATASSTASSAVRSPPPSDISGREKLKRHRIEIAGRVWIPESWGQEELLKDWIDCSAFDSTLFPNGIMSARAALVEEGRRANSGRLRIENRC